MAQSHSLGPRRPPGLPVPAAAVRLIQGGRGQTPGPRSRPGRGWLLLLLLLVLMSCAFGADRETPDVVVIVDTSRSMTEPGMDPERTSLLVAKLLADIVPGQLSVVRSLDLVADQDVLPRIETDETGTCEEAAGGACRRVKPVGDWGALARTNLLGVLKRGQRGDQAFKDQLATHLAQTRTNSYFHLSFRAAQGVFQQHAAKGQASDNRAVIWLSDGRDQDEGDLSAAVADLRADGTRIETIVFGRGDPAIPQRLGLAPVRVTTPAQLMGAFAQVFRQLMQAPYRVDHRVDETPEFTVRANVQTMWVVVYGDISLTAVTLHGADGRTYAADDAADSWPSAGAYRVARIAAPAAGTWRVETRGGGPQRAYAVIQRSALGPILMEPGRAQAGVATRLIAAVAAGGDRTPVTDREALEGARITTLIDGLEVVFNDDGSGADERAGDGRFSALHRFTRAGPAPFELILASPFAQDRQAVSIDVTGGFRYTGADPDVHFGTLRAPTSNCRPVPLPTDPGVLEQRGAMPFELLADGGLPAGHRLWVRLGEQRLDPGGTADWAAGAPLQVCLELDGSAPSSSADGERTLTLRVRGSEATPQRIRLRLHWEVLGLSLWQRWGWLVLTLLAALALLVVALGFILPQRFQPTLAISFGPERDDVDDYPPQPIRNWRGVGIGFYRNARAYLRPDFRLSGQAQGALAALFAQGTSTRVQAQRGLTLYREDVIGGWTELPAGGEITRPGEVYRIGERGPFFRLSAR